MNTYWICEHLSGIEYGRVTKFARNPRSERWVAYSVHGELQRSFPTLQEAEEWLVAVHGALRGLVP